MTFTGPRGAGELGCTPPKVSVVIPTHDRAGPVLTAIDSVLAQTFTDLEILVIDDGSTDGTAAALRDRYEGDQRVQVLDQPHRGVSAARNRGLDAARGALIAFLDSDDRWQPFKLELQVECLKALPEVGMIWTEMRGIDANGDEIPGSSLHDILSFRDGLDEMFGERRAVPPVAAGGAGTAGTDGKLYVGDISAYMALGNMVLPSAVLMRRSCLERVGRFDETLEVSGEDFDFFLRTARTGPVALLDVPTVLHQLGREDQLTHPSRSLHLARNYLRTMEGSLARHGRPAEIGEARVRAARAYGNFWIARASLEAGQVAPARRHIVRTLRLGRRDARTLVVTVLAFLPQPVSGWLLRLARRVQRLRSRRPS